MCTGSAFAKGLAMPNQQPTSAELCAELGAMALDAKKRTIDLLQRALAQSGGDESVNEVISCLALIATAATIENARSARGH